MAKSKRTDKNNGENSSTTHEFQDVRSKLKSNAQSPTLKGKSKPLSFASLRNAIKLPGFFQRGNQQEKKNESFKVSATNAKKPDVDSRALVYSDKIKKVQNAKRPEHIPKKLQQTRTEKTQTTFKPIDTSADTIVAVGDKGNQGKAHIKGAASETMSGLNTSPRTKPQLATSAAKTPMKQEPKSLFLFGMPKFSLPKLPRASRNTKSKKNNPSKDAIIVSPQGDNTGAIVISSRMTPLVIELNKPKLALNLEYNSDFELYFEKADLKQKIQKHLESYFIKFMELQREIFIEDKTVSHETSGRRPRLESSYVLDEVQTITTAPKIDMEKFTKKYIERNGDRIRDLMKSEAEKIIAHISNRKDLEEFKKVKNADRLLSDAISTVHDSLNIRAAATAFKKSGLVDSSPVQPRKLLGTIPEHNLKHREVEPPSIVKAPIKNVEVAPNKIKATEDSPGNIIRASGLGQGGFSGPVKNSFDIDLNGFNLKGNISPQNTQIITSALFIECLKSKLLQKLDLIPSDDSAKNKGNILQADLNNYIKEAEAYLEGGGNTAGQLVNYMTRRNNNRLI